MSTLSVLIINFSIFSGEQAQFHRQWPHVPLAASRNAKVYLIDFAMSGCASLLEWGRNNSQQQQQSSPQWSLIYHSRRRGTSQSGWSQLLSDLVSHLPLRRISVVLYNGHSGGVVIGSWRRGSRRPQVSIVQFARAIAPLSPTIVGFDGCHMGQLLSLYELAAVTRYVIATPSYCGLYNAGSILVSNTLSRLTRDILASPTATERWFGRLLRERANRVRARSYDCMVVYRCRYLEPLVSRLRQLAQQRRLVFTQSGLLLREDRNTFDLRSVIGADHIAADRLRQVVPRRRYITCSRGFGLSVEHFAYCRHRALYRQSRLFRSAPELFERRCMCDGYGDN